MSVYDDLMQAERLAIPVHRFDAAVEWAQARAQHRRRKQTIRRREINGAAYWAIDDSAPPSTAWCWCPNYADGRRHPFSRGRGVGLCGEAPTASEVGVVERAKCRFCGDSIQRPGRSGKPLLFEHDDPRIIHHAVPEPAPTEASEVDQ